jgi:hypothetical protein
MHGKEIVQTTNSMFERGSENYGGRKIPRVVTPVSVQIRSIRKIKERENATRNCL